MSGGGGGTSTGWGEGPAGDPCNMNFPTQLGNPSPAAIAAVHEGLELRIELNEAGPSINAMNGDQRVGSIVDRVPALLRCIREGNEYLAVVDRVVGGQVEVTVRNI